MVANSVCYGEHGVINVINDGSRFVKIKSGTIVGYAEFFFIKLLLMNKMRR